MTVAARPAILLTLVVGLLVGCDGSTSAPAPRTASRSAPPTGSTVAPTSSTPTFSGPQPSLPSDFGTGNPCAQASTTFTAASAYVGVAQLGRTDVAQRCVQGSAVPRAITAAITATSVAGYFTPTGSTTGSTITFRRIDQSSTVTVTVARSGDGYAVTRVTSS